jgi:putative DNA primase/helicase
MEDHPMKDSVTKSKKKSKNALGKTKPNESRGPLLTLKIDGTKRKMPVAKLTNDEFVSALQKECDQSDDGVKVWLTHLLDFQDKERFNILDFVATLAKCRLIVEGQGFDNLFDAILALPVNSQDLQRVRRLKLAALEVAVILFPDALEVACSRVQERLRKLNVKGVRTEDLVRDARKIEAALGTNVSVGEAVAARVCDVLPGAPVSADIVLPLGWRLTLSGIDKPHADIPAVSAPVVIVERGKDARRGNELVTLAWHRDGVWHRRVVDRREIADQRSIINLAALGLPVTSINARTLIQYLDDFEAVNLKHLPLIQISHKMGWQGKDGQDGFLWGRNLVTSEKIFLEGAEVKNTSSQQVRFRGVDEGDDQLADGFRKSGTFQGWVKAVEFLQDHPRALLALYASFVPPMFPVLETSNHVIDFAGGSTSGKTTVLRVAASVWGNPDERSTGAVVSTWNCTATWRERVPAVCCHLPLILDDTKNVRFPDEVAKTIYGITQGRGRGRGTVKGVAEQASAETILLSSGEQPATSFTKDGGTRPRVLSLWGSPFGETSTEMGQRIRGVNDAIHKHYGHAGPRFVQYMLKHRGEWEEWREWYQELVSFYEKKAGKNFIAGRMAAHFAAMVATSYHVHKALQLPWKWKNPIKPLWEELISVSAEADVAARGLVLTMDWAVAHRQDFAHLHVAESNQPHGGWVGRWDKDSKETKWPWIGFFAHVLENVLKEGGFDPDATIRTWKDRGWIEVDSEGVGHGRNTKRVQVGKELARLVAIKRAAVEELQGGEKG